MNNTETSSTSNWERVQSGVKDTERCISQKQYNMAMIKARQTLEYMVKCLCEQEGITEGNLIDMIDALYKADIIDRLTCEHYHTIRTLGNKAIHEEDNSAYHANQAHHLLSQQVYTFAGQNNTPKHRPSHPKRKINPPAIPKAASPGGNDNYWKNRFSRGLISRGNILKSFLIILIIAILIFIIKMLRTDSAQIKTPNSTLSTEIQTEPSTEVSAETMEAETEPVETEPAETEPAETKPAETEAPTKEETQAETEPPAPTIIGYRASDTMNVRPKPSTNNDRIGVLSPGTKVEYVRDYDDTWSIIKYYGKDAYVSKALLAPITQ